MLRRVIPLAILLGVLASAGGCATGPAASTDVARRDAARPPLPPDEALHELAVREMPAPPATPLPVPPGVEPAALDLRPDDDPRARRTLDEILPRLAASLEMQVPPPPAEPGVADPEAALRHYVLGREAALRNENYLAVLELEKALALDPDSPPILREIARASQALGNLPRAAAFFQRLLALDPDDTEALFTIALSAIDRRDFETAAAAIARPLLAGDTFRHDPAAELLADFILFRALEHLGFDRAAIEAGLNVVEAPLRPLSRSVLAIELASVFRQRGSVWRAIGDSHCRLGEYGAALDAYGAAAEIRMSDPSALYPRVIYAELSQGRVHRAQEALLAVLSQEAPEVSETTVRLSGYVAEHGGDTALLTQAVESIYRAHPDSASCARAASSLLAPGPATQLLREFIGRRPRDLEAVGDLLAWLARRDMSSAATMTVALAADQPDLDAAYTERFMLATPRFAGALEALRALPPSAARSVVEGRLLISVGALGEAWQVADAGRRQWSDDPRLLLLRMDLATLLDEPALVDEAIQDAAAYDTFDTWLARARAERARRRPAAAMDAAEQAARLAPDRPEAPVERARALLGLAERAEDEVPRQRWADQAAAAAEQAITLDPTHDDAYEVLLSLYRAGGPLEDIDRVRQVAARLRAASPDSRLYARLSAEEALSRQRDEEGVEQLLRLYDNDPSDTDALALAVAGWNRSRRLDAAERWLESRLEARPDDPALLSQWARVLIAQERLGEVEQAMRDRLDADPNDYTARSLLETAYRSTGRATEAFALGEQRLLARPRGVRRELELAALYAGAERAREAEARLRWILEHADEATVEILGAAVGLAGRLEAMRAGMESLTIALAERTIQRFPAAPLQVYGAALRSLSRMGRLNEQFDRIAEQAARAADGASDATMAGALQWRELAQALVDAGQPRAAARALRARIQVDTELEPRALALLARMALASDAASDAAEASIDLLREMHRRSALRWLVGGAEPTLADALYETSSMYSIVGRHAGADRLLEETLRLDPDREMAMNNLGYTRIEAGRHDEQTIAWIEEAHVRAPNDENILDTVGWLRYLQGRFRGDDAAPGALELIERAVQVSQDPSAEVYDHLGDAWWRLGEPERAVEAWERAARRLDDEALREVIRRNLRQIQLAQWGLLVADPDALYHEQFGALLERVQEKLARVRRGEDPSVAPTFEELTQSPEPPGEP